MKVMLGCRYTFEYESVDPTGPVYSPASHPLHSPYRYITFLLQSLLQLRIASRVVDATNFQGLVALISMQACM